MHIILKGGIAFKRMTHLQVYMIRVATKTFVLYAKFGLNVMLSTTVCEVCDPDPDPIILHIYSSTLRFTAVVTTCRWNNFQSHPSQLYLIWILTHQFFEVFHPPEEKRILTQTKGNQRNRLDRTEWQNLQWEGGFIMTVLKVKMLISYETWLWWTTKVNAIILEYHKKAIVNI